jgi:Cft2 family RNA processing exonuclease
MQHAYSVNNVQKVSQNRSQSSLLIDVQVEAPEVDTVLLSHPDIAHLGALPLLMGRGGMQVQSC